MSNLFFHRVFFVEKHQNPCDSHGSLVGVRGWIRRHIGQVAPTMVTYNSVLKAFAKARKKTGFFLRFGSVADLIIWLVVSNIFYFHPYLGKIPILTNIFQRGWNHQLVMWWARDTKNMLCFCFVGLELLGIWSNYWETTTRETKIVIPKKGTSRIARKVSFILFFVAWFTCEWCQIVGWFDRIK